MGCLSVARKILGTPKTLCRRSSFHVHPNHLSQLPFRAPLQPRLPPRVSGAPGMVRTPTTHSTTMEKQPREGLGGGGGTWEGDKSWAT